MIIGVDMGASAVKICALEGDAIVFTRTTSTAGAGTSGNAGRLGLDAAEAEAIALTGLTSPAWRRLGRPLSYIRAGGNRRAPAG